MLARQQTLETRPAPAEAVTPAAAAPFPRTLFLYKAGRKERIASGAPFPADMFYGCLALRERGHPVELVEEDDIRRLAPAGGLETAARLLALPFRGFPAAIEYAGVLGHPAVRRFLKGFDALVATTNTLGFSLALLKRLGLVRARVLFIVMGIDFDRIPAWQRPLALSLLGACEVLPLAQAEVEFLRPRLRPGHPIRLLPFGVGVGFWSRRPDFRPAEPPYVLSIGNDLNRDYGTLIGAWRPEFPLLRIVTRLAVASDKANVEIVAGDWRRRLFSDADVRALMHGALFVVVPIRDTIQPAGQSATLAAMACGKAVVLSEIRGLWNREVMRTDETCILTPPGSAGALADAVAALVADPARADAIGARAQGAVAERLDAGVTADILCDVLQHPPRP